MSLFVEEDDALVTQRMRREGYSPDLAPRSVAQRPGRLGNQLLSNTEVIYEHDEISSSQNSAAGADKEAGRPQRKAKPTQ